MNLCRQMSRHLWSNRGGLRILRCHKPNFYPHKSTVTTKEQNAVIIEDSYVKKFMKAVGWTDQLRTKLKLTGFFLYESVPYKVSYDVWFEKFDLPDTFASWFIVTELHVWLLMVRCMAEDTSFNSKVQKAVKGDGYFIRNCIVEALWADVSNRIKLLEGVNHSLARKEVNELSEQFQAAIVGYDEGLSDDRVLAAAIWRRFYAMSQDVSASHLEGIVNFIRRQMMELDTISSDKLTNKPDIEWLCVGKIDL